MTTFCNKTGYSEGSRSLPTPSKRTHLPNWIASSIVLIKLASVVLTTLIPYSCLDPRFLINLLAWLWGSIIKGHLFVLSMMIPFYVEVSSFGNPAIFQPWMVTGTPIKALIEIFFVWSMFNSFNLASHVFYILFLYSAVNGPA